MGGNHLLNMCGVLLFPIYHRGASPQIRSHAAKTRGKSLEGSWKKAKKMCCKLRDAMHVCIIITTCNKELFYADRQIKIKKIRREMLKSNYLRPSPRLDCRRSHYRRILEQNLSVPFKRKGRRGAELCPFGAIGLYH